MITEDFRPPAGEHPPGSCKGPVSQDDRGCTEFLVRMFAAGTPGHLATPPATAHLPASTPSILTLHKQAQGSDIGGATPGIPRGDDGA